MANPLAEQLRKAGLVNDRQLKQAQKEKYRDAAQQSGSKTVSVSHQQAQAAKAERDRELNRQRQEDQARKALQAQIRQIVEQNRLPKQEGELAYNFVDNGKIKKMYVTEQVRDQLGRGSLAIVRLDAGYELVTREVAEKIQQRDVAAIVMLNERVSSPTEAGEEDPYAAYQVPDDLMW